MKKDLCFLILTCLLFGSARAQSLDVVATFSILGDFVYAVGGDNVNLTVLVGPDGDTHEYEPVPRDSVALAEAALVFENGLGLEPWLDDLYEASGSRATRVTASDGVAPLTVAEAGESEPDPHIWHSVPNAVQMVENVRAALVAADPAHAEAYNVNAAAYTAELQALDAYVRGRVATLPPERRKLVTSHDTFGYFAREYGFEIVGAVLPSVSTESADPGAGELAALIEKVRAADVPAVFAENIVNPGLLDQVAKSAGVAVAPTLYTDALGAVGTKGETYLDLERYNVDTITTALEK
ncbi:metal ABC transporter substrate-binding protein [soil metagenome]